MASTKKEKTQIVCRGPKKKKNGALFLRFPREDGRKTPIEIYNGQRLTVGHDLTENEAKTLLKNPTWTFEEVKINE